MSKLRVETYCATFFAIGFKCQIIDMETLVNG